MKSETKVRERKVRYEEGTTLCARTDK